MKWITALTLGLAVGLSACAGLPGVQPSVEGVEPRIAGLDLDGLDVVFDVKVYNPLPSAIHAPRFRYALDVQERTLASGRQAAGADFPATGVGTVPIPARITYRELEALYGDLSGRSEADYHLSGEFKVPLFGSTVDLPFEHAGALPIVRPPEIELQNVDTSGVSALGGEIVIDIGLTNPNGFALGVDDLGYGLLLRGSDVGSLSGTTGGDVGPGEKRTLRLTGKVSAIDAVKGLVGGSGDIAGVRPSGQVNTPYGPLKLR